jgi:hypothetical protein
MVQWSTSATDEDCRTYGWYDIHRISQEDRSVYWEVRVSVIRSKKIYMYTCPIPNGFRDRVISPYSSKIVDKKEYYLLFLIPVFIVQVTKLV